MFAFAFISFFPLYLTSYNLFSIINWHSPNSGILSITFDLSVSHFLLLSPRNKTCSDLSFFPSVTRYYIYYISFFSMACCLSYSTLSVSLSASDVHPCLNMHLSFFSQSLHSLWMVRCMYKHVKPTATLPNLCQKILPTFSDLSISPCIIFFIFNNVHIFRYFLFIYYSQCGQVCGYLNTDFSESLNPPPQDCRKKNLI